MLALVTSAVPAPTSVLAGRATCPGTKRASKVRGVLVTECGGDRFHALLCFVQELARPVVQYLAPEFAKAGLFLLQSSIQGALRHVQPAGDTVQVGQGRLAGTHQGADIL